LTSPGSIAAAILQRAGVVPPLAKFPKPDDDALDRWIAAHHGGWQTAEAAGCGAFTAADIDQTAGYVQSAILCGCWRYQTAGAIREDDVTESLRGWLTSPDLAEHVLERRTWRRWGLTLVEIEPDGHELPLDVDGEPSERSGLRQVHSDTPLPYTWPDVVLTTLRRGHPPRIVRATRLVAVGRQPGLQRTVPILPGLVVAPDDDPAVALVHRRLRAKARGDERLAAQLRVVVNALVYGLAARLDPQPDGTERPGPWAWPPLASTVTAGTRLLIGLAELLIEREVLG
jgi:hypothetical protein